MPLLALISWLVAFCLMEAWVIYQTGLRLEPILTSAVLTAPAACLIAIGVTRLARWLLRMRAQFAQRTPSDSLTG